MNEFPIKVTSATISVSYGADGDYYYEIVYCKPDDPEPYVGFGSYDLERVQGYLKSNEYFEFVPDPRLGRKRKRKNVVIGVCSFNGLV